MIVMIDGKKVKCKNDIRIIHETTINNGWTGDEDLECELHTIINNEGMITDLNVDGTVTKSGWKTIDDLVEECH